MQEFAWPVTLGIMLVFALVGFLPPRLPLWARLLLQVIGGVVIYKGFSEAMFHMPNEDSGLVSQLFGGNGGDPQNFNKLALGVVAPALGILVSLLAAGVRRLRSRSTE